jgi:RNA polymerase sigma-70 factor (ECF subfamily)
VPLDSVEEVAAADASHDPLLERRLRDLVSRLPPMARAVVLLKYQEDLDPSEIARTLDMPLNTVKSHLQRSLASLRAGCDELRPISTGSQP